jgi:type IV pilus assembly protein PilQ
MAAHAAGKGRSKRAAVATIPGGTIEALPSAPREYTGQRISLDFKDADIQNVLRILADVSGLNIITTDDVQGKITMRLVEVPWDQALDSILKARGLDMVRDGNIIRVSTVEKLKEEREALRAANEAQAQAEPLKVRYIKVNYAKADEKFVKKVQEILTERGSATWDERTNTIVVRDIDKGIADAEELITHVDTQTPQILIEASIVEATENFSRDLGVQWGYTYKASPETGNAPGVNFPGRINAGGSGLGTGVGSTAPGQIPMGRVPFIADFPANVAPGAGSAFDVLLGSIDGTKSLAARLTALEREGKGKIISRPRVVTLNNQPAKIESLEILRVKLPSTGTVISTGAGGVAGSSQAATEQIKTGITLTVTPQLSSDGFVFLDVFAKSSTLQPPAQSQAPSPDNIPNEISREAESHVLIKDGETFVLGGVFRNTLNDNENGIPYLRAIPVLGWAFKNTLTNDNRQELLVFITPRSVRARGSEDLASLPSAEVLWQDRNNP